MTDVWQYLKTCGKPIVLYGTGNGADKIMAVLNAYGIPVSDIFVSDEFYRGGAFHGFELIKFQDVQKKYEDCVIVLAFAIFRDDMLNRVKEIEKVYEVLAPEVPVFGTDYFSIDTVKKYEKEIGEVRKILADSKSLDVFDNLLQYRLTGRLANLYAAESDRQEAFDDIIKLGVKETYLDLGAYRGDTIEEFLTLTGGNYEGIVALEPDTKNYKKLCEKVEELDLDNDKVFLVNKASWNKEARMDFSGGGGRNSNLLTTDDTKVEIVTATDLDSLLAGFSKDIKPTYIKMDVEGAEQETLLGLKNTLKSKPKLAISAYHKTADLFALPLLVKELNPDYMVYLRHHPYIPDWETNLYCI